MFNERSMSRFQGVDPRLVQMLTHVRQATGVPFEVSEGLRERARQEELVRAGKSQTMNSRHLTGNAVDIHILNPDGSVNWDFGAYRPLADAAKAYAAEQGWNDFVWGGDWRTLKDGVHFQIGGSGGGSPTGLLTGGSGSDVIAGTQGGDTMATPSQPRLGLLDVFRGDASFRDVLNSGDWRDRAILALEGNTLNPNLGLMAQAQGNIANRREDQKTQQAAAQEAQQRNRTAEWLRANGQGQLADLLLSGGVDARTVLGMLPKPEAPPTTDDIKEWQFYAQQAQSAGQQPLPFNEWMLQNRRAGATNVNVGDQGPRMGTVPPGYVAVPDPAQPSGFRFEAITGSEAQQAQQDAVKREEAAAAREQSQAGLLSEEIGRAKQKIQESPTLTTGILGSMLKNWGGTPSADLSALLDTIGANISFDALNAMRAASPTGAALGAVQVRELELLQATAGNLSQSQSAEQLMQNLERLQRQFDEVVNGPAASRIPPVPQGVTPDKWPTLWEQMTPEERALFK